MLNAFLGDAGANITVGYVNSWITGDDEESESISGFNFGISWINYDTDRTFILEPGIRFATRGFSFNESWNETGWGGTTYVGWYKEEIKSTHLDLFLKAKYNIDRNFGGNISLFLYPYIGIAGSLTLSAKGTGSDFETWTGPTSGSYSDSWSNEDVMDEYNSFNALLALGVDVLINDVWTIGIEFNRSLGSIMASDPDWGEWNIYYNTIIFNIGYALRF